MPSVINVGPILGSHAIRCSFGVIYTPNDVPIIGLINITYPAQHLLEGYDGRIKFRENDGSGRVSIINTRQGQANNIF